MRKDEFSFNSKDWKKIILMSIVSLYGALWLISFWGMAVFVLYDKNPGDIAKFWIKVNASYPWFSLLVLFVVVVTIYKLIKNERKDIDIYQKYPLNR